jgi:hypothetical protein
MAFLSGTTCKELVRELGRNTPTTANKLMDIITNYAVGEEAVGVIFGGDQDKGKRKDEEPKGSNRGAKRNNRKKKKKNQQGKHEATTDDLVVAADRKKPRGPPGGGIFDKMLKELCPYTRGPQTTTSRTATCFGNTSKAWALRKTTRRRTLRKRTMTRTRGFPRSTTAL